MNPTVIYGAVSAFGHVGPEAGLVGMDVIAQARSGLLFALGAESEGVPVHSEVQAADYATAALLFAGLSSALFARERTGRGQKVEVSLLAGALFLQGNSIHHLYDHDGWRQDFVDTVLPLARRLGQTPSEIAKLRDELRPDKGIDRSTYRIVRTADGYVAIAAGGPTGRRRLLEAVGLDPELTTRNSPEVSEAIDNAFGAKTTAYWVERLVAAPVPIADVRHVDEMLFDRHVLAEGLVIDVDHPAVGRYRTAGAPVRLSETPFESRAPSPGFSEHTIDILEELGFGPDEIRALVRAGAVAAARRE